MSLLELFILAVGLSMDAFAVSICEGLSAKKLGKKHYLIVGAWVVGSGAGRAPDFFMTWRNET